MCFNLELSKLDEVGREVVRRGEGERGTGGRGVGEKVRRGEGGRRGERWIGARERERKFLRRSEEHG